MIDRLKNRIGAALAECADKAEKAAVKRELISFFNKSYKFYGDRPLSLRQIYREALKDRRYFRETLDEAGKSPTDPATGTCEILNTPSTAEIRYYRLRNVPVPPIY